MLTNCINCGAVLTSKKCEYCGTDYSGNFESSINDEFKGKLTYQGKTYDVYMADCEVKMLDFGSYRDMNGDLCIRVAETKRKFTLIEY